MYSIIGFTAQRNFVFFFISCRCTMYEHCSEDKCYHFIIYMMDHLLLLNCLSWSCFVINNPLDITVSVAFLLVWLLQIYFFSSQCLSFSIFHEHVDLFWTSYFKKDFLFLLVHIVNDHNLLRVCCHFFGCFLLGVGIHVNFNWLMTLLISIGGDFVASCISLSTLRGCLKIYFSNF